MSLLKLTLVIAMFAVCYAHDDWTKCEPSDEHINAMKECIKLELAMDTDGKDLKEIAKSTSHENIHKVITCTMKKKGILTEDMEYVEEKALECVDGFKAEETIKEEIKEGITACGKDLDHKSPEDQKKIFKCTKDVVKKHCA